jgi:hypothetical protein
MSERSLKALVLATLLGPAVAQASPVLGLRLGLSLPGGNAYQSADLGRTLQQSDLASVGVPMELEVGWRFGGHLAAGVYYSYTLTSTGQGLKDIASTAGGRANRPTTQRVGVLASWAFDQRGALTPWAGVSAGMEQVRFGLKDVAFGGQPASIDGRVRGWEAGLHGGVDWRLDDHLAMGPFLALATGQYTVQAVTLGGATVASGGVASAKTHQWYTLGVRGTYGL